MAVKWPLASRHGEVWRGLVRRGQAGHGTAWVIKGAAPVSAGPFLLFEPSVPERRPVAVQRKARVQGWNHFAVERAPRLALPERR